jgi:hypothetical protein
MLASYKEKNAQSRGKGLFLFLRGRVGCQKWLSDPSWFKGWVSTFYTYEDGNKINFPIKTSRRASIMNLISEIFTLVIESRESRACGELTAKAVMKKFEGSLQGFK